MRNEHQTVRLSLTFVLAFVFLMLLAWSLTACQASGQDVLPRLLAVIEMPNDIGGGTARSAIHPNGWAYIVNDAGSIAVLDGPRLVKLMPWPGGRPAAWTHTDIGVNPQDGHVYVPDGVMSKVHMISGTEVVATIPVSGYLPSRVMIDPDNGNVYVLAFGPRGPNAKGFVNVINGTIVITHIQIGIVPQVIVANPVDGNVYVGQTRPSSNTQAKMLAIIKGTELVTQTNLGLDDMYGAITDIAVNPNTGEMYMIPNYGTLIYWDGKQDVRMIDMYKHGGYSLNHVAVDTKRNWAYVTSWDGPPSHVAAVDKDNVIADVEVPGYDIRDVVYDATHDYVYVANRLSGTMSIIRGTKVITTVSTGGMGPTYITVDEKRGYIYVSNATSHSVAVYGYASESNDKSAWKQFLSFLRR